MDLRGNGFIGRAVSIADADEERGRARSHAEPPLDRVRRNTAGMDYAIVDAVQMMRGADHGAIVASVVAAAGAEADVVVVQVPP